MKLEFPYQIVTFLGREPQAGEPVYNGDNGWFAQLAIKRRFKINGINEEDLTDSLKTFFSKIDRCNIITGWLIEPKQMPVQVVDVINQEELKNIHGQLIASLGSTIISRYPDRDGGNYYPHITAEYNNSFVIPVDEYVNKKFAFDNVWLLKDIGDEDSKAHIKIM